MALRVRRAGARAPGVMAYTVVIPAHAAGAFVHEAVASALAQTVPPARVLVVDDGSPDDTAARAAAAGATVLRHDTARGPAAARNHGTTAATTPLVAYLDADDRWQAGHMAALLPLLRDAQDVVAFGSARTFGAARAATTRHLPTTEPQDLGEALLTHNPVVQSGTCVPRALWDQVGGYDESLWAAEDYDFWLRIALVGRFHYSGQATVERRVHAGQLSRRRQAMVQGGWLARRRYVAARVAREPDFKPRALAALVAGGRDDLNWATWLGDAAAARVITAEVARADAELAFGGALAQGVAGPWTARMARTARTLVNRFRGREAS